MGEPIDTAKVAELILYRKGLAGSPVVHGKHHTEHMERLLLPSSLTNIT